MPPPVATTQILPEELKRAVEFDPTCVVLGTRIIDWGSFGWGNTVKIVPAALGVTMKTVRTVAYRWAKEHSAVVHTEVSPDGFILYVCFTRKNMVDLQMNQGEWLGAIER